MGVAHISLDFRLGGQGRDRIDDDDVDRAGPDEGFGDIQGLFAGVRLGDPEFVDVDPEVLGVDRVEGVFGVDEGGNAADLLGFRDRMEGERRLSRGLRTVDLDDPSTGIAADAQGLVEQDGTGRDDLDAGRVRRRTELHERALAELLLYLQPGGFQSLRFRFEFCGSFEFPGVLLCHTCLPLVTTAPYDGSLQFCRVYLNHGKKSTVF